jgi:hypothetical protein
MDKSGNFWVFDEKNWCVIPNQIPVSLFGIKLDCKSLGSLSVSALSLLSANR